MENSKFIRRIIISVCIHREKKNYEENSSVKRCASSIYAETTALVVFICLVNLFYFILSLHLFNQRNEYLQHDDISRLRTCIFTAWIVNDAVRKSIFFYFIIFQNKQLNKIVITQRALVRHDFNINFFIFER